jgi:hypothetical protein
MKNCHLFVSSADELFMKDKDVLLGSVTELMLMMGKSSGVLGFEQMGQRGINLLKEGPVAGLILRQQPQSPAVEEDSLQCRKRIAPVRVELPDNLGNVEHLHRERMLLRMA